MLRIYRAQALEVPCTLTCVVLSWGRPHLLASAVVSLKENTDTDHRIAVVDNGSDDVTVSTIYDLISAGCVDAAWFLPENRGGLSFDLPVPHIRSRYIHFSENDVQYRPGWDTELIQKFHAFPLLGQLSPFGPTPESELGEIWVDHPSVPTTGGAHTINISMSNIGSTCMVPAELVQSGLRWANIVSGYFRWPNDHAYSCEIRQKGRFVAWNDRYVATNWGHNITEWSQDLDYYRESYGHKRWVGLRGMRRRIEQSGYSATWLVLDSSA